MKHVTIYTDGSCPDNGKRGIQRRGGWAAILIYNQEAKVLRGNAEDTTNQRMELTAIREALAALKQPCEVTLFTDSEFAIGTLTQHWRRKDPGCAAISAQIDPLLRKHRVTFEHVKGHTGDLYNEQCDEMARDEALLK